MSVPVHDPFGAAGDPAIPVLPAALRPEEVEPSLLRALAPGPLARDAVRLRAVRVVRHKPGRRCLVEYTMETAGPAPGAVTLLGKIRGRGVDRATYELTRRLRAAGFDESAPDGVSVPEAVGIAPELHMWLQRRVEGSVATPLLTQPGAAPLARRIADAAARLNGAAAFASRSHTLHDELAILRARLGATAAAHPRLARRIQRVLRACEQASERATPTRAAGIHRDFYPDQVLVSGARLYLLDLDLFSLGEPALDIGNFIGHLLEQGIRVPAGARACAAAARAMAARFLRDAGEGARPALRLYTTLTLARHVHLSTRIAGRAHCTLPLLELCEARFGLRAARAADPAHPTIPDGGP